MKLRARRGTMLLTICCLVLTAVVLARRWVSLSKPAAVSKENNPNDFYLWQSNTGFAYTFRYDPRAADEWRFSFGGESKEILQAAEKRDGRTTNKENTAARGNDAR